MESLRQQARAVVIAASAGGVQALLQLVSKLPPDFPAPVIIVQHLPPVGVYQSLLAELLSVRSSLPVKWIEDGEPVCPGIVYLSPQDRQSRISKSLTFELLTGPQGCERRPAADPLFASVADSFRERAVGIVLSGYLSDGAAGAQQIAEAGGRVFAQDQSTALAFDMPKAAIRLGAVDFVLSPTAMAHALIALLMAPGAEAWFRVAREARLAYV